MEAFRILFTGVGRRVELLQAFRQAALSQGVDVKLYGADMAGTAPALAYCDFTRRVCAMTDGRYVTELLDVCRMDRIDLLVPTIDTDLLVLAENKALFEAAGTRVLVSASEMIRLCRDKRETFAFFVSCGLCAPEPVDDYRRYSARFPAFIKPRDGSSSIDAFRVDSAEALAVYAGRVPDYIVQPFVEGREYTIDVFCDFDGKPVSIVPRERLAVRAGEVLKTKICLDGQMIEEARSIIERFRPCGPLTVQLIREKDTGVDWFIEINPRFGGGSPLSMKAGARSAETILLLLAGRNAADARCALSDGAVYSRFDQSVCIDAGPAPQPLRGVIFDLDDTLYSEKQYVRSGFRAVARFLGDGGAVERLWAHFEAGSPAIDAYLGEIGRTELIPDCLRVYRSHTPEIALYDGAAELLAALKAKGLKVGVITDGRPEGQRSKLRALGLDALADDVIITDELGGVQFRKPNDVAFRIMQTRWRLPYEQLLYVGDNPAKDFQAPAQLGMRSVWFENEDGIYAGAPAARGFCTASGSIRSLSELSRFL